MTISFSTNPFTHMVVVTAAERDILAPSEHTPSPSNCLTLRGLITDAIRLYVERGPQVLDLEVWVNHSETSELMFREADQELRKRPDRIDLL